MFIISLVPPMMAVLFHIVDFMEVAEESSIIPKARLDLFI